MHQMGISRRWRVLAIVVAAQFMFGVGDGAVVRGGAFDGQARLRGFSVRDVYGTAAHIANALGAGRNVCIVGAVCVVDYYRGRISVVDAPRGCLIPLTLKIWGLTAHGLFILQCSNYLVLVGLEIEISHQGATVVPCQECRVSQAPVKA